MSIAHTRILSVFTVALACAVAVLGCNKPAAKPAPKAQCFKEGAEILCDDEYEVLSAVIQEGSHAAARTAMVGPASWSMNTKYIAGKYFLPQRVHQSAPKECIADFIRANQRAWKFSNRFSASVNVELTPQKHAFPHGSTGALRKRYWFGRVARPGFNRSRDQALVGWTTTDLRHEYQIFELFRRSPSGTSPRQWRFVKRFGDADR